MNKSIIFDRYYILYRLSFQLRSNVPSAPYSTRQLNHYEVLGVKRDSTQKDIKLAYYKKCKQLHPDNNKSDPNSHNKFIALNKAYSVLSEVQARKNYDQSFSNPSGYGNSPNGSRQTYQDRYYQAYTRPGYAYSNQYWQEAEYQSKYRAYRAARAANSDYSSKEGDDFIRSPVLAMIGIVVVLAVFQFTVVRNIYHRDINDLHNNFSFNDQTTSSIRQLVSEADATVIEEKIKFYREEEEKRAKKRQEDIDRQIKKREEEREKQIAYRNVQMREKRILEGVKAAKSEESAQ